MPIIHKKILTLVGVIGLSLLGVRAFLKQRYAERELTSLRSLACNGKIGSIDLFYIPYGTRTRAPVSPEQLEAITRGVIHIDNRDLLDEFCGRMRAITAGFGFNTGFDARWGVVGYVQKSERRFSIYGDGNSRCVINGVVFPCTDEISVWVEKLFFARK